MAKTIKATTTAEIKYSYKNEDEVATTQENQAVTNESGYTTGDGANEAEVIWRRQVTVTAAAPNYDLDLHGGLADVFGDTIDFRNVRSLLVRNLSTTPNDNIDVGPQGIDDGLSEPWGGDGDGKNTVHASGSLVLDAPKDGFTTIGGRYLRISYQGTSGSINAVLLLLGLEGVAESSSSSTSTSSWSSFSSTSTLSSSSSSSTVSASSSTSSSTSSLSSSSSSSEEFSTSCAASRSSVSTSSAALAQSSASLSSSSSGGSSLSSSSSSSSSSEAFSSSSSSSPSSSSSSSGGSSLSSSSSAESSSSSSSEPSSSSSSPATSSSSSSGPTTLTVTGFPFPDVTGTYDAWGQYNGTTYWKIQGGSWSIWWDTIHWQLTNAVGVTTGPRWSIANPVDDPTGDYTPASGGALGTATVSA